MIRITVDGDIRSRLGDLQSPAELQDESGRVLAYLTPAVDAAVYAKLDPQISEDELDRREQGSPGRPLSDILSDLENKGLSLSPNEIHSGLAT